MKLPPWYLTGLVEGEGCFCITISRHKTNKTGFDSRLVFEIEMIIEDKPLLEKLQKTLDCGHIYILNYERYGWRPHVKFAVKNHHEIIEKIIPFFKKHKLQGIKGKSFEDFCTIAAVVKGRQNVSRLNDEELETVRKLKFGMNKRYGSPGAENPLAGWERTITSM